MVSGGQEAEEAGSGSGRFEPLFRLIWWPLFLLVTAATLAGPYSIPRDYDAQWRPFSEFGLRWNSDTETLGQPLGDESRAAGVEAGRTVLAVNGRRPDADAPGQSPSELIAGVSGDRLTLVTSGPDGDIRTHQLRRGPHHLEQAYAGSPISASTLLWIENPLEFLAGLLGIAAAVLLYRRHGRDRVAAVLSLAFLLLSGEGNAADATFQLVGAPAIPFTFKTIGYAALFIGILMFPNGQFWPRRAVWLAPVIAAWAALAIAVKFGDLPASEGQMNLAGGVLALLSVALLAGRYRRLPPSIERQQIRWATFGFVVGAALAATTAIAEQAMAGADDPATYAWLRLLLAIVLPAAPLALAAGLLISLLRFRLYDADVVISRSAAAAALTLALAAVYAAASQTIETLFQSSFGREGGLWPGAVGAALAVLLVVPLSTRIQAWAERRFQKGVLELRRDLPDCVGDLRETAGLDELLREILARVRTGAQATAAAVEIDGRIIARDGGAASLPLRVPLRIGHRGEEVGGLLLGPRPDGTSPGKDERQALEEVADPIARAIHIVRRREERERALEARLAELERLVRSPPRNGPEAAAAAE
ncbi:MAG TPA: hypothetical protein VD846_00140 [Allosphingosinicella sp.]|nr:hypothetical protein [Allosphingosinicella sp.]